MTNSENINQVKEPQYSPLRLIGILTITFFCTVMLIAATFTRVKVFNIMQPLVAIMHPDFFPDLQSVLTLKAYFYIPQVPVILFAASLLGGACAMTSVFFYIVLGLAFLPVFGLGGGFDYVLQPSFGYLLAFLPAALIAGKITDKEHSFKSMLHAALIAVLTVHFLGFFYMFLVELIQHQKFVHIMDWLVFESFARACYDFIFGFLFMVLAKYLRKLIWILTAV